MLNMAIPVEALIVVDDVPTQSTFTAVSLDFTPYDVVQDKTNPVLYMSDTDKKQIVAYNFDTKTKRILQLEDTPKKLTLNNGELFVCLSKNDKNASKKGSIAIIDSETFNSNNPSIKEKFDTDDEPVFINVDKNNYMYVYSGTTFNGSLTSYDRVSKKAVNSVQCHGSSAVINNTLDRLYINGMDFDGYSFSTFIESYSIDDGIIKRIMKNNDTGSGLGASMKISPDDKFIVSGTAAAYLCSSNNLEDLVLRKNLYDSIGYFREAAFDQNNNNFYMADELSVKAFDSETFAALKAYKTNYHIDKVFYFSNKIVTVTHNNNTSYVETSDTGQLLKRPYLVKSSIDHSMINISAPDELTFEFNKDILIKDIEGIKVFDYLRGVREKNGVDFDIDASASGNKLTIKIRSKIGALDNVYIDIAYNAVTDKNGQPLAEGIYKMFSTKADDDNSNRFVEVIDRTEILSGNETIGGGIVIPKDVTMVVKPGANLSVNGDIIVHGKLINLGNINASGKVYALKNIDGLVDNRDKDYSAYFRNKGSRTNCDVSDKFPSPIIYMNPDSDISINSPSIKVSYVLIPNITLTVNGQYAAYESRPAGTMTVKNIKPGKSKLQIETTDEINNVIDTELNVDNAFPALNIEGVYPSENENYAIPVNQEFYIKFDQNIIVGDDFDKITITDRDTGICGINSSIINDESGNPTILRIAPQINLRYFGEVTLNIPYSAVKNSEGSVMQEDYEAKFNTGYEYTYLSGKDRYETSIRISEEGWYSSPVLVLASGENFPDALSAGPLASKYNAPILLSESKELRGDTEKEIYRLNPQKVFIVGGEASISKDIENKLCAKGMEIVRIGGINRYETSMKVASYVGISEKNGCVLVSGENYPDALSIASYAASNGMPVILTEKDNLPSGFTEFMNKNVKAPDPKVYVIGGTGVISKALEDSIPFAHQRFGGKDRYETNFEIISNLEFDPTYTYFASGSGFADALSGCAMASLSNSPIILVDKNMGEDAVRNLNYNKDVFIMKYILGGQVNVSNIFSD
jgi:putative cell wall-binding protein